MSIYKYRKIDYPLSLLSFMFLLILIHYRIKNLQFIYFTVILSLISRVFQYYLLIESLRKGISMDFKILMTFFISHFALFTSLYYLNYILYEDNAFIYPGGKQPGDKVINQEAKKHFEDNLGVNLFYYSANLFFSGSGDIFANTSFAKIINIFNTIDSAGLIGFLISYIFHTFVKKRSSILV
jgi:hypothetical protein